MTTIDNIEGLERSEGRKSEAATKGSVVRGSRWFIYAEDHDDPEQRFAAAIDMGKVTHVSDGCDGVMLVYVGETEVPVYFGEPQLQQWYEFMNAFAAYHAGKLCDAKPIAFRKGSPCRGHYWIAGTWFLYVVTHEDRKDGDEVMAIDMRTVEFVMMEDTEAFDVNGKHGIFQLEVVRHLFDALKQMG